MWKSNFFMYKDKILLLYFILLVLFLITYSSEFGDISLKTASEGVKILFYPVYLQPIIFYESSIYRPVKFILNSVGYGLLSFANIILVYKIFTASKFWILNLCFILYLGTLALGFFSFFAMEMSGKPVADAYIYNIYYIIAPFLYILFIFIMIRYNKNTVYIISKALIITIWLYSFSFIQYFANCL